jgi:hypothetical protein
MNKNNNCNEWFVIERSHKLCVYASALVFKVLYSSLIMVQIGTETCKGRFTYACRAHAVSCHAVPLRVWNVSFQCDLHSAALSDSHLPCRPHAIPDHALLLKATTKHGSRETACELLARVRLLPVTTRSSTKLSDAYQYQMQLASVKPNTVCMDEEKRGSSTLQKIRSVTLLD